MRKLMHLLGVTCFMLLFMTNTSTAQFGREYQGDGEYQYKSPYPNSDLHFYLFGDGHHSFEKEPIHQYGVTPNMQLAIVGHEPPYDDDVDVEEFTFSSFPQTSPNPQTPAYELSNMVELKKSWNLTALNDNYYILSFENFESEAPISGCIEFHYNINHTVVQNPNILDNYGNDWVSNRVYKGSDYQGLGLNRSVVWNFEDLELGEQRMVYIKADCIASTATFVKTLAVMKITDCAQKLPYDKEGDGSQEGIYDSELYLDESMVQTTPHDPNMIVSLPNCLEKESKEVTVRYRFYFQNIGDDPAIKVEIDFNTSEPINGASLVQASANCGLSSFTDHSFEIDFPNIWLPGITACSPPGQFLNQTNCTANVGWVDVDVCYDLEFLPLEWGECVNSSIDITFDNEAPVRALYDLCREMCHEYCFIPKENCHLNNVYIGDLYIQNNSNSQAQEPIPEFVCPDNISQYANTIANGPPIIFNNSISEFTLYPNPARETLQIDFVETGEEVELIIMDLYGKVIHKSKTITSKEIDINDLSTGTYSITLKSKDSVKNKLFIKI